MGDEGFDYENRVWGRSRVRAADHSFAGVRVGHLLPSLPAQGRVLEWGCGAGRMLGAVQAARPELSLVGLDVSRAALDLGAEAYPGIAFRHCDADAPLPAEDGEFDAVYILDALEHVDDPARILAELHRVLTPGGVLHLNVPCEGDSLALWRWMPRTVRNWKRDLGGHIQRFRRSDIATLLDHAGFETTRTRYSLQLVGNLADVATFAALALARRLRPEEAITTGDLIERSQAQHTRMLPRIQAAAVRAVDFVLWAEAQLLARIPSWCIHLDARRLQAPRADC